MDTNAEWALARMSGPIILGLVRFLHNLWGKVIHKGYGVKTVRSPAWPGSSAYYAGYTPQVRGVYL